MIEAGRHERDRETIEPKRQEEETTEYEDEDEYQYEYDFRDRTML